MTMPLSYGVPQGSILESKGYPMYVAALFKIGGKI